jgi:hypothetical protein
MVASVAALERMAADIARVRAQPPVLHASQIEAQRREREAEAARRAGPDPRMVLRQTHQLHAEAQAEVDRIAPLVERARRLVDDLEGGQQQQDAAAEVARNAAAEALIAAITAGQDAPLLPPLDVSAAEATAGEPASARAAPR